MSVNIHPLHDRIVVRRAEEENTSPGGIFIPDTAKGKPTFGTVLAIGTGKPLDNGQVRALAVKVGDKVLFSQYSGTEVDHKGEKLLVIREEDIMGVVEA
ncbi:MAG: co-chaperone GroES [Gammaproteobacteria bacterium]|jgi:chaperonin GroES|nr:co-chaperone GroES [Gammaproteobacteria bacterium]